MKEKDKTLFKCHVCGAEGEMYDFAIHQKDVSERFGFPAGSRMVIQNIRYCADKVECLLKAPDVDFLKSSSTEQGTVPPSESDEDHLDDFVESMRPVSNAAQDIYKDALTKKKIDELFVCMKCFAWYFAGENDPKILCPFCNRKSLRKIMDIESTETAQIGRYMKGIVDQPDNVAVLLVRSSPDAVIVVGVRSHCRHVIRGVIFNDDPRTFGSETRDLVTGYVSMLMDSACQHCGGTSKEDDGLIVDDPTGEWNRIVSGELAKRQPKDEKVVKLFTSKNEIIWK